MKGKNKQENMWTRDYLNIHDTKRWIMKRQWKQQERDAIKGKGGEMGQKWTAIKQDRRRRRSNGGRPQRVHAGEGTVGGSGRKAAFIID